MNFENEDEWLSPKEQAKFLGISLSKVYFFLRQTPPPYPYYTVTPTRKNAKKSDLKKYLRSMKVSAYEQRL